MPRGFKVVVGRGLKNDARQEHRPAGRLSFPTDGYSFGIGCGGDTSKEE